MYKKNNPRGEAIITERRLPTEDEINQIICGQQEIRKDFDFEYVIDNLDGEYFSKADIIERGNQTLEYKEKTKVIDSLVLANENNVVMEEESINSVYLRVTAPIPIKQSKGMALVASSNHQEEQDFAPISASICNLYEMFFPSSIDESQQFEQPYKQQYVEFLRLLSNSIDEYKRCTKVLDKLLGEVPPHAQREVHLQQHLKTPYNSPNGKKTISFLGNISVYKFNSTKVEKPITETLKPLKNPPLIIFSWSNANEHAIQKCKMPLLDLNAHEDSEDERYDTQICEGLRW
jgi:hypothetical protein